MDLALYPLGGFADEHISQQTRYGLSVEDESPEIEILLESDLLEGE
jgi:hypothetical protein